MVTFYVVMFLENSLLVIAWLVAVWDQAPWYRDTVPLVVFLSFAVGIGFMAVYYRFFHVRRLHYEAGGRPSVYGHNCDSTQRLSNQEATLGDPVIIACKEEATATKGVESNGHLLALNGYAQPRYAVANGHAAPLPYHNGIPGVFNCRFNNPAAATKRKKKKPTTFVPPPSVGVTVSVPSAIGHPLAASNTTAALDENPSVVPFWRRPLPSHHNHQVLLLASLLPYLLTYRHTRQN